MKFGAGFALTAQALFSLSQIIPIPNFFGTL